MIVLMDRFRVDRLHLYDHAILWQVSHAAVIDTQTELSSVTSKRPVAGMMHSSRQCG